MTNGEALLAMTVRCLVSLRAQRGNLDGVAGVVKATGLPRRYAPRNDEWQALLAMTKGEALLGMTNGEALLGMTNGEALLGMTT